MTTWVSRFDKHFDESIHRNSDHCHLISKEEYVKERRRDDLERILKWYQNGYAPKTIKTFRQYVRFRRMKNLKGNTTWCFTCMSLFKPTKTTEQIYKEYLKSLEVEKAEKAKTHYNQFN